MLLLSRYSFFATWNKTRGENFMK